MKQDLFKKELKTKQKEDLEKIIGELKEKLRQLRFDLAAGKIKNVRELRKIKKQIAIVSTLLNQRKEK